MIDYSTRTRFHDRRSNWQVFRLTVILLLTLLLSGSIAPLATHASPPMQIHDDVCRVLPVDPAGLGKLSTGSISGNCVAEYDFTYSGGHRVFQFIIAGDDTITNAQKDFASQKTWHPGLGGGGGGEESISGFEEITNGDQKYHKLVIVYRRGTCVVQLSTVIVSTNTILVDQAKKIAAAIDGRIGTVCKSPAFASQSSSQSSASSAQSSIQSSVQSSVQPPAKPPVVSTFGVGHGCAYNSVQYASQVFCAATTTNELPNATIEYQWAFDSEAPAKGGNTFSRKDESITPGSHTVTVVARDTKNNQQATTSFTFTKAGADLYVTVQCALRYGDDRAVACYADPKNMPEGTTLTYEWTWSGTREGESSRTLNKTNLADGVYNISVRAKDSKSGKYTTSASTSITIGNPPPGITIESLAAGINSALTGTPLPNSPDPIAAAAAAATTAVLVGLGALANALTSAGGAATQTAASGAGTQTAKPADAQSPTKPKPSDLPEQSELETEAKDKKGKPEVKPDTTPPRVFDTKTPVPLDTKNTGKDAAETPDKSDAKDKPIGRPDTAAAKPTTLPEQKPQLTPEQIADRRQQADRSRQEGMREASRENTWAGLMNVGYYGAKTVKYGADVAVDFLSNLTGPMGKTVKYIYAGSKNFSEAAMQSYYDGKGRENMIKAAASTAIDIGASAIGSKFNYKPKPNPVDGFTRSPDQYTDKMRHYSTDYVRFLLNRERTVPGGSKIVRDRFIDAGIATAQSEGRRVLIKDPIKMDLGLKEGKYLEQWW